jgi:hypothetical protein
LMLVNVSGEIVNGIDFDLFFSSLLYNRNITKVNTNIL